MPEDAVIQIQGLRKRYGSVVAVDGLSFSVGRGRITGFVGPNGAGKTTTLRALLGLVAPTEGSATIFGKPYRALKDPKRRVGAILEATDVHPGRTGRGHLRVLAAGAGIPTSRADELLETVGLADAAGRRVRGYSLGMRQRLGLAGALLGEPDVLILDEPANGLDPEGIRWLRTFLRGLAAEGRTVLVSSHVLAELAQTADDVAIIARGRLVAHAPLAELTARAAAGSRVRAADSAAFANALRAEGIEVREAADGALETSAPPERVGEVAAAHAVVLHELVGLTSSLEEVFLDLTGTETGE